MTSAFADEVSIQASYDSYRSARDSGDLRTARDFAREAYEDALSTYGHGAADVNRYAAAYGQLLNEILDHDTAWEVLEPAADAAAASKDDVAEFAFELYLETGRALRGREAYRSSRAQFRLAVQTAEALYGVDSIQAGYANLELARTRPDRSDWFSSDDQHYRAIGTNYGLHRGSEASLDRAQAIFSQHSGHNVELEVLNVIRAGNLLADNDHQSAGQILEPAIDALVGYGYMDDYVLTIYIDWIGRHLTRWSNRRMERQLTRAYELGALRAEGAPLPLARGMSIQNRRTCIDSDEGYIEMVFSVNEQGQLPRIRLHETSHPDRWDQSVWNAMRSWVYVPGQVEGETVRVDGLRHRWHFSGESRSC